MTPSDMSSKREHSEAVKFRWTIGSKGKNMETSYYSNKTRSGLKLSGIRMVLVEVRRSEQMWIHSESVDAGIFPSSLLVR